MEQGTICKIKERCNLKEGVIYRTPSLWDKLADFEINISYIVDCGK